ncbi:surface lipoprotein assembly modifier [Psychrobacter lutiphocae]|uniref:surface lipoprotein assembly modifier n=1 Tax=Psychrobacter lutiphocae TaxID=540500 RepID=UPI00035CCA18|nr:surface lipoprotein assembly modifier [Psychrobacter lutiphocae]
MLFVAVSTFAQSTASESNILKDPEIKEPVSFHSPLDTIANTVSPTQVAPPTQIQTSKDNQQMTSSFEGNAPRTSALEASITEAIKAHNWPALATLLEDYIEQPNYDALLYHYAKGAWYRSQRQHHLAIAEYQKVVDTDASLHYPRFDLGVMLFENKQYNQAKTEIATAKPYLNPQMRQTAEYYLQQIDKRQAWQPDVTFHYEANDNVNNAASAKVIDWNGKQWTKTDDSLPKSAHGIRYGIGANRDLNINGNHFMSMELSTDGVHYWDNRDYNEQSIRLKAGYKYQDINRSITILPFAEQNWLEGSKYNTITGLQIFSSQRLNANFSNALAWGYNQKDYADEAIAKSYDGHLLSATGTLMYSVSPVWLVYGGLSFSDDKLNSAEKSSTRHGVSLGSTKIFANGVGTRFSLSYHKREFDAPGTIVYDFVRKDNEYRVQGEVWHNRLNYKGFVPHLNVSYLNIDSNMEGFYSRDNLQWLISVNKDF